MRRLFVLVLVVLLAGCVDPAAGPRGQAVQQDGNAAPTTAIPAAADPKPTDDNGSISGDIVSDEAIPVAGARVALVGLDLLTESDESGRFTFNGVPPGDHGLQINKIGYEQAGKRVTVSAGEVTEIRILLVPLAVPEPRIEHFIQDGYVEIGLGLVAASVHRTAAGTDGSETRDFYYPVANDVVSGVAALQWDSSAPMTAKYVHFNMHTCAMDDCDLINETRGGSPLRLRNDDVSEKLAGRSKTQLSTYFNVQGCYRAAQPTDVGACNPDSTVQVVFQQRFKIYVDAFFVSFPPPGYSPLPPA